MYMNHKLETIAALASLLASLSLHGCGDTGADDPCVTDGVGCGETGSATTAGTTHETTAVTTEEATSDSAVCGNGIVDEGEVAYQEVMLAPARADELRAGFSATEVEEEVLAREAQLRDSGERRQPLAAGFSWGRDANRVPVGWLGLWTKGRRLPKVWVVGAVVAVLVVTSTVVAFLQSNPPEVAGVNGVPISDDIGEDSAELDGASTGIRAELWAGNCDFSEPPVFPPTPDIDVRAPQTGRSCGVVETALKDTDAPMNLIGLSGGEFTMGSPAGEGDEDEYPQHRVSLSRFAICETEVSVRQYELITQQKPSYCDYGCEPEHPVQNVNWEDSAKFLNALTRYENRHRSPEDKLTECYEETTWAWDHACTGYRLPTEAEWEYATRAGTKTRYFFGDDDNGVCSYANVRSDCNNGFEKLAPVKTDKLKPNPWGLHATAGNVWEWAYDSYDSRAYAHTTNVNPARESSETDRVLRGGSFFYGPMGARSAVRVWSSREARNRIVGFRCARGPSPQH